MLMLTELAELAHATWHKYIQLVDPATEWEDEHKACLAETWDKTDQEWWADTVLTALASVDYNWDWIDLYLTEQVHAYIEKWSIPPEDDLTVDPATVSWFVRARYAFINNLAQTIELDGFNHNNAPWGFQLVGAQTPLDLDDDLTDLDDLAVLDDDLDDAPVASLTPSVDATSDC